uniref:Antitoxin n=1 Tax=Caenorhabditis tropicalis TaxID=1561998 RepID=A0A1I7TQ26_9PELO
MSLVSNEGLPDEYQWFSDQIAGHHPSVIKNGKREIGLLKIPGSQEILKPKQDASRGEKEVSFTPNSRAEPSGPTALAKRNPGHAPQARLKEALIEGLQGGQEYSLKFGSFYRVVIITLIQKHPFFS